jgi:hypothetical protein
MTVTSLQLSRLPCNRLSPELRLLKRLRRLVLVTL